MKPTYFGTNLKMYKTNQDTISYLSELSAYILEISKTNNIISFVIPSYIALNDAVKTIKAKSAPILIGAQNMNEHDEGQFTGEISPVMLGALGINLIMLGHSERRHIMKETDTEINGKVLSALKHQFKTLLCIGETAGQKNYGIADETLRTQLKIGLHNVEQSMISNLWIAYEPVWAIGTNGTPATSDYANAKHKVIRACLIELFGEQGKKIPLLYGGSVNPDNAKELIIQEHIDGLFVGRSAWDARAFNHLIIDSINELRK